MFRLYIAFRKRTKLGVIKIFIAPVENMAWFTQWSISPGGGTDEIVHFTDMAITI